jgi:hypothetical protein
MSRPNVRKALRLYEEFTGMAGEVVGTVNVPELKRDDVLVVIGDCEAIAYSTVRNGKRESYQHEFRASSRPVLAASHDGHRLYLLAGAYRFTDRGIEDR